MTDPANIACYIDSASALLALPLEQEQRERVIHNFTMAAMVIAPLLDHAIPPDVEAAPTFTA